MLVVDIGGRTTDVAVFENGQFEIGNAAAKQGR
jgi:N-methylhydantoinase A/oxoprolinase/acetone carboxylase beta subunit